MKRAKESTSGERQVAVRGSVVLGVVVVFVAWLWHAASPASDGEVFGFAADGSKLYRPVAHVIAPRTTSSPFVRAWQPQSARHQP